MWKAKASVRLSVDVDTGFLCFIVVMLVVLTRALLPVLSSTPSHLSSTLKEYCVSARRFLGYLIFSPVWSPGAANDFKNSLFLSCGHLTRAEWRMFPSHIWSPPQPASCCCHLVMALTFSDKAFSCERPTAQRYVWKKGHSLT